MSFVWPELHFGEPPAKIKTSPCGFGQNQGWKKKVKENKFCVVAKPKGHKYLALQIRKQKLLVFAWHSLPTLLITLKASNFIKQKKKKRDKTFVLC